MTLADRRKFFLKIVFILLTLSLVGVYGYMKMRNLIWGPSISVSEPQDGMTIPKGTVIVRGLAKNVSSLSMDDRPIFTDENGNFSEMMTLLPGYNIISIKGEDKFGKKTEKVIRLVLKN